MAAPTLPLTVPDLVCLEDMDPAALETTSDLQTLEQDVFHILIERPGSNLDDQERGIGVEDLLSSAADTSFAHITQIIELQLAKDDRIDSVTATLTALEDGSYELQVDLVAGGQLLPLGYIYTSANGLEAR